jgi:hypothetical protein
MRFFHVTVQESPPAGSVGEWLEAKIPALSEERRICEEYASLPLVPQEIFNRCVDAAVDAAVGGELESLEHSSLEW